ncbi:MAG TPA: hypothetical protein VFO80_01305 [Sphingomonas sp.]|nr:hypothetical protein [Sphingomonas sp.]
MRSDKRIAFIGAVGLAVCSTQAVARDGDRAVPRRIMPYMTVTLDRTSGGGDGRDRSIAANKVGGYTRLRLVYVPPTPSAAVRDYDVERRNGVLRWIAGKAIARVFSVKTTLVQPRLTTVTLAASVARESSSKVGENWTTELNADRNLTPYFRIDPDTAVGIETSFVLSSTYDASISKAVIDVVRRGAQLVAPSTTLVTSLNGDRFDRAADFIDNSIANLLKEYIVERATNDFPLKDVAGTRLMAIRLLAPIDNEITPARKDRANLQPIEIVTWEVWSEQPLLSVFSSVPWSPVVGIRERTPRKTCQGRPDACQAFSDLDPQTVLNFVVAENVTIAQALAGEPAIGAARDDLMKAKPADSAGPAKMLCALVADKAHRLGFNRFDVGAITWAYASQSNLGEGGVSLRKIDNCTTLRIAYDAGLPQAEFTAATPDPGT